ncbi:hypothetical protein [Actinoplanes sp. TFC3]|uniref:hypothetical protein n=1 Tax=Actinoplanes sp. TFC3 TaxID=1710355 RepID=UPI000831D6DA|nr:hypothetical protein [Actinoplanes sp. TFC3]
MPDGDDVTHPPAPPAAPPAIPHQRGYRGPIELHELPPGALTSYPRKSRRALLVNGILALVAALALAGGAVYVVGHRTLSTPTEAAAAPAKKLPGTPFEAVLAALKVQSNALLKNDEKGWLAAVDPGQPKLLAHYQSVFTSLRALGVTSFDYKLHSDDYSSTKAMGLIADLSYCFTDNPCPTGKDDRPKTKQKLKVKVVRGKWVITASTTKKSEDDLQPAPWENGDLVFAKGKRVTLVAQASEKKYFAELLPVAEAAAAVNDRFATLVNNPQKRYRVYLAGKKQWQTWYGGMSDKWVVGFASPLNKAGMDVVLNMPALKNEPRLLRTTIQHELGHVVTLGASHSEDNGTGDMWLEEGVAEYIGWYPQPATASWRRQSVHALFAGSHRPKSIAVRALGSDARMEEGDSFYGFGHFAADCMAKKYGQGALFTFVRLYLREDKDLDAAARQAFGQSFSAVDRTCLAYIRSRA